MKVLSLFSGVGGFDMGLEQGGMETVFQCEWDKNCRTILDKHWPTVPKWDDVSTLTGKHILANAPVIDIVAWGSPCQDLSIAGKRSGLEGERSGLFHQGIRIIKELREETNGQYPRISIWENVAGALNSNGGADFGVILDQMAEAGAVAIEWGVVDAQHWVPQRRKRVFVIAIFDPAIAERCPSPLLPFSESLPGHLTKSKPKRQSAATTLTEGAGTDGAIVNAIGASIYHKSTVVNQDVNSGHVVVEAFTPSSFANYSEGVGTLRSNGGDLGGGSETLITEPFVKASRAQTSEDSETWVSGEVNPTLNSFDQGDVRATTAIVELMLIDGTRVSDVRVYQPPVQTLKERMGTGGNNVPMLAFDTQFGSNANVVEDISPTLKSTQTSPSVAFNEFSSTKMVVRRLTPLECERLMGWPDEHTRWKADGTEQSDTQRYKQCGNGVVSAVSQWIATQIMKGL